VRSVFLVFAALATLNCTLAAPQVATPPEAIVTLTGFKVERLYSVPGNRQGSWVNMTFDPKGRLIVSDQYGALYRVTLRGTETPVVEPIPAAIGEAQGLLCVGDSLYVVVNNSGRYASGLYRLRDLNGDDRYDEVKLLRKFEGNGEHGPHAVVLGPDMKSLYIVAGNFTKIPASEISLPTPVWGEDQLLPRMPDGGGHDPHVMAPAGWIARTDLDGSKFELVAMGMRNAYDLAFNHEGELFSYDSDMEWDIGLPWYRPTRICHVVSGADFGWRNGSGKFPTYYPDSVPPVVDVGPGSPVGVTFGYGAKFPAKYQKALFALDWSYGIIYAVHLEPSGSSYKGTLEKFVTGQPLPVTDAVVGPDGALYFTTGGRKTQSGLYRVTYTGAESTEALGSEPTPEFAKERELRRAIEKIHSSPSAASLDMIWENLSHNDRFIRYAARVALEHLPPATYLARVATETDSTKKIAAVLAIARTAPKAPTDELLGMLATLGDAQLTEEQQLDALRTIGVIFARHGRPSADPAKHVVEKLSAAYPAKSWFLNRELVQVLAYLQAPGVIPKTLALMADAATQDEQIHYAAALRTVKTGWTLDQRKEYFAWFHKAAGFRGGNSFAGFFRTMRTDAMTEMTPQDVQGLGELLREPVPTKTIATVGPPRNLVKEYGLDELVSLVDGHLKDRDYDRGRRVFGLAQCANCHRFNQEGGIGGPDLTALSGRFSQKDLLESIVDPSKTVSDQYQAMQFELNDGRVIVGRIVNQNGGNMNVLPNLLAPNEMVGVQANKVESITPSKTSLMPAGLLNTFDADEIRDLMAYLLSRGDRNSEMFKK
jgi:putative heme-binding domain-containing protein